MLRNLQRVSALATLLLSSSLAGIVVAGDTLQLVEPGEVATYTTPLPDLEEREWSEVFYEACVFFHTVVRCGSLRGLTSSTYNT